MNAISNQGIWMRPGQKNRMRGGRSSNNNSGGGSRRGPNPLTRSYESNGPDVKVRGTPQHIAEKYVQLARDAHTASDTVMAESYLQHAEHYYRIIAAAQYAQQTAYNQANGLPNPVSDDAVDDEDEFEVAGADRFTFRTPQSFQQPNGFNSQNGGFNGQPGQQSYGDVPGGGDQPSMPEGQMLDNNSQQGFQPRPPRPERPFDNRRPFEDRGDRPPGGRDRQNRRFGRDRNFGDRPNGEGRLGEGRPGEERFAPADNSGESGPSAGAPAYIPDEQPGLPSFITAPVRLLGGDEGESSGAGRDVADPDGGAADVRLRNRRRRRPRADGAPDAGGDEPV
jgi:Domain of unknown function (DUF4167)